ncbi:hypothetical protein, partial [Acinetobacter ursingii]|uniref:hypothetical protein n=1 Tax=Acinetobacter ursingii TaxID=108980 RepID=UPI003008C1F4
NLDIFKTHSNQPKYQSNPPRPNQHPVFQQVFIRITADECAFYSIISSSQALFWFLIFKCLSFKPNYI